MNAWYTLFTKPNSEYPVAAMLRQQNVETYLPEVNISTAGRNPQRKPFFPCYLFINIDLDTAGPSALQWIPGTRRLIAFGGQPVAVPDPVIDLIRTNLEAIDATGGLTPHSFKPGDIVRVTGGPFKGMQAIFEGPTTPAERVHILLSVLGRASRVQIAAADLEKVSSDDPQSLPVPKRTRRTRGKGRRIKGSGSVAKNSGP